MGRKRQKQDGREWFTKLTKVREIDGRGDGERGEDKIHFMSDKIPIYAYASDGAG